MLFIVCKQILCKSQIDLSIFYSFHNYFRSSKVPNVILVRVKYICWVLILHWIPGDVKMNKILFCSADTAVSDTGIVLLYI